MMDNAKECVSLYLLKAPDNPKKQAQVASSISFPLFSKSSNNNSAIMLWHYKLGHPNFLYLKKLFPTLFDNTNAEVFQCKECELSKRVRNNYHL